MGNYQQDDKPLPPDVVGLPVRPFLYTVEQLSTILSLDPKAITRTYLFFEGRSTGVPPRDLIRAVNIAPAGKKPEWRVVERELIRWMRVKGFRYYEAGWFTR